MTDKPPDYTTMSGAEFQRAVGTDPMKWSEAYWQRTRKKALELGPDNDDYIEELAEWFRDAMDAARKDRIGRVIGEGEVHGP